jgi:DNA recombination protein RmuC
MLQYFIVGLCVVAVALLLALLFFVLGLSKSQASSGAESARIAQTATEMQSALQSLRQTMVETAAAEELRFDRLRTAVDISNQNIRTSVDSQAEKMRTTMEQRLGDIQKDSQEKLEVIRHTVDEKLSATLNRRLGESFSLVNERLEAVYKGLGEMQNLAVGVGDLKNVLTNVKTRGTWGEVQLESMLSQIMAPGQYEKNVPIRSGSKNSAFVDFAIILPGAGDDRVLIPIDAKFPMEDYQRILLASEEGDKAMLDEACAALERSVRVQAKSIKDKYILPPQTTDFACMYLPTEGLYAEVLRRPGLCELLQREYRVIVTGPTTISALLNSLQIGFRTLAIEKRTGEVWELLGAVKSEFGKFAGILEKTHRNLTQAANSIDDAARKTRTIERRLRNVETLDDERTQELLGDIVD